MKVICDRGALVESLNLVGGVVVSRTPKPVLTCVKLEAAGDTLTLSATDMEVSVTLSTPRVEVGQKGAALVPADKITQIVRESIDPTLTINTDNDVAVITGADSKFKVYGHPPADFPGIPEFKGEPDFVVTAGDLHRLVAMTLFATARENSRYAINGVLFERDGNKLSVVATDGHRLALARGSCKGGEGKVSAIVPSKALNLLLRLFDDADESVKVKLTENQILFATDAAVLSSNLVEGNFPPYADVIPKDGDKKATLATDVLISAVRRAALLTNEESKGVRMAFGPDGLTLSSRAPEMGEAEIKVEVAEYNGEAIEIGFNPAYVLDALKVVDESQVQMDFKAPNKPGVLRTGPNFLYVVMPVNLQ
jgi:DNA polymerase-3 subunit beta